MIPATAAIIPATATLADLYSATAAIGRPSPVYYGWDDPSGIAHPTRLRSAIAIRSATHVYKSYLAWTRPKGDHAPLFQGKASPARRPMDGRADPELIEAMFTASRQIGLDGRIRSRRKGG